MAWWPLPSLCRLWAALWARLCLFSKSYDTCSLSGMSDREIGYDWTIPSWALATYIRRRWIQYRGYRRTNSTCPGQERSQISLAHSLCKSLLANYRIYKLSYILYYIALPPKRKKTKLLWKWVKRSKIYLFIYSSLRGMWSHRDKNKNKMLVSGLFVHDWGCDFTGFAKSLYLLSPSLSHLLTLFPTRSS